MCAWRVALESDLAKLWPVLRGAHVFSGPDDLESFYRSGPWRMRISDTGDALLLARWRQHLPVLAMKGAWCPDHRMPSLLADALSVTRAQGFETLLSPLLAESMQAPYLAAGMSIAEKLVVLQGMTNSGTPGAKAPATVRRAAPHDAELLAAMDRECFGDFWRHGLGEWEAATRRERVVIAEDGDALLGYASASVHGSVCTLGRLGVRAGARRRGIGTHLVNDVVMWAFREGIPLVSLCTQADNDASRALYHRAGLVEIEEPYALLAADVGSAPLSDTL
jgi:ribosomal-protein-alanine N-acetyltransferase